jgi:hypothetical protein
VPTHLRTEWIIERVISKTSITAFKLRLKARMARVSWYPWTETYVPCSFDSISYHGKIRRSQVCNQQIYSTAIGLLRKVEYFWDQRAGLHSWRTWRTEQRTKWEETSFSWVPRLNSTTPYDAAFWRISWRQRLRNRTREVWEADVILARAVEDSWSEILEKKIDFVRKKKV